MGDASRNASESMEINFVPGLWLLITAGGAAVLGLALAYALISTRRRRANRAAQAATAAATRDLYRHEEEQRKLEEEGEAVPRQVP
jgi:hypothetical protein